MSTQSLRGRLELATMGDWSFGQKGVVCWPDDPPPAMAPILARDERATNWAADADLIVHAPTDLRLALDVIEAARVHSRILRGVASLGEVSSSLSKLETTLDAFEATP